MMFGSFEKFLARIMSFLKSDVNDYSDLETTQGNAFVYKDGSMATVLMNDGLRSLIGRSEFEDLTHDVAGKLDPYFAKRGHLMQIVYVRDEDPEDSLNVILDPSYETADKLQLDVTDILDEKKAVYRSMCMDEKNFIVLWTRPTLIDKEELQTSVAEARALSKKHNLPTFEHAQNILRPNRFLVEQHAAFVEKIAQDLISLKCAITRVDAKRAFCDIKRYLFPETPVSWAPTLVGDPIIARWKQNNNFKDASEFIYPRLDDQLFHSRGVNGNKKGVGGITETGCVRMGDRVFAPVMMKIAPTSPKPFNDLFRSMNQAIVEDSKGRKRRTPYSISYTIEGDGLSTLGMRKLFATILGPTSPDNRNLASATRSLETYRDMEDGVVVKMQITMVTWAEATDMDLLLGRRRKMSGALLGWGRPSIEIERGDPTEALIGAAPAISISSPANPSAPPLRVATQMFPWTRPSGIFRNGSKPLRSLDGKLMTWSTFSDEQNTWLKLGFGGPGSGKSVFFNGDNLDMCLMPGLTRLPWIGVIDIGVSSSGFIDLVRDALPEHMQYLASYVRVQNREDFAMNQFDTQLGLRTPLPREKTAMKAFLVALATPPERGVAHTYMNEFCDRILGDTFKMYSDQYDRGEPKRYSPGRSSVVDEKLTAFGIATRESTRWWNVVDLLFAKGAFYEASVAQRYAVPELQDVLRAASNPNLEKEYSEAQENGVSVVSEFKLMISSALGEYPIFRGPTVFDTGESRIMSLDLQDVVTDGGASEKKQAALMYMISLNAFMRKISIIKEDLTAPQMNPTYRSYHSQRVDELAEDMKRLFVDEYHKTGNNERLRDAFLIYGRESRKWMLEIVLASQLPRDFGELAKIATTILIMDQGNVQTRQEIAEVFGLTPTEISALRTYVNGPQRGVGMTFLAKVKTKSAEISQIFTSTTGGLELWGLSTTAEDKALRSLVYQSMSGRDARRCLKDRFPNGSCQSYVKDVAAKTKLERGSSFLDDDFDGTVIQGLASEMIAKWKTKLEREAAVV